MGNLSHQVFARVVGMVPLTILVTLTALITDGRMPLFPHQTLMSPARAPDIYVMAESSKDESPVLRGPPKAPTELMSASQKRRLQPVHDLKRSTIYERPDPKDERGW